MSMGDSGQNTGENAGEREQAAETREEKIHLLDAAFSEIDEAITITDAQLNWPGPRILFVNQGMTRITGYSAAELVGQTPRMLQGPRTERAELARLRRELSESEHFQGRAINYRKGGEAFMMDWKITPVRDADGRVTNYIAVQRDVTEESTQREERASLERMDSLGRLAGAIAHDFNNVMTAVLSLSAELREQLPETSPLSQIVEDLQSASQYAQSLTRQLLAFSRKQEAKREDIDVVTLLRQTEGLLRRLIRKDVDLVFTTPRQELSVRAAKGQVEQIIVNLVMNASEAIETEGRVGVKVSRLYVDEADARQDAAVPGNYALLEVVDNGPGMDARTKEQLFDPFFTTKAAGEGTGMGLASVLSNVRSMNGMIRVDSEVGRGTEFQVYIPLAADQVNEGSGT